jgi:hypothetical protein
MKQRIISCLVVIFAISSIVFAGNNNKEVGIERTVTSSLVSFESQLNGERVDIKWETKNQHSVVAFTIEKSRDGVSFETLCEVKTSEVSTAYMDYFNVDFDVWEGKTYYRITEMDVFGNSFKSNIVALIDTKKRKHHTVEVSERTISLDGVNGKFLAEDKFEDETLVVLRNRKGEEVYSNVFITNRNGEVYTGYDTEEYIPEGKYLVVATNDDRLFGKKLKVTKW